MAFGRESARVAQIKVLDLARHPGLNAVHLASLPPERRYRYEVERAKLELQVEEASSYFFERPSGVSAPARMFRLARTSLSLLPHLVAFPSVHPAARSAS